TGKGAGEDGAVNEAEIATEVRTPGAILASGPAAPPGAGAARVVLLLPAAGAANRPAVVRVSAVRRFGAGLVRDRALLVGIHGLGCPFRCASGRLIGRAAASGNHAQLEDHGQGDHLFHATPLALALSRNIGALTSIRGLPVLLPRSSDSV